MDPLCHVIMSPLSANLKWLNEQTDEPPGWLPDAKLRVVALAMFIGPSEIRLRCQIGRDGTDSPVLFPLLDET